MCQRKHKCICGIPSSVAASSKLAGQAESISCVGHASACPNAGLPPGGKLKHAPPRLIVSRENFDKPLIFFGAGLDFGSF
jgi:hypothetical protein